MLKTRLWMGSLLILLVIGVLRFDPPVYYPCLLLLAVLLAILGSFELHHLIGASRGLPSWLCVVSVMAVLLANWPAHLWPGWFGGDPWQVVVAVFTAVVLLGFLVEMAAFRPPSPPTPLPLRTGGEGSHFHPSPPVLRGRGVGGEGEEGAVVIRLALLVWTTAYLGLLPSFLVQLRWLNGGAAALGMAIFIPKCCDIGAYFSGRLFGRHPMSPTLSPKKTWEGLVGGLLLSAMTAVAINRPLSVIPGGPWSAAAFGLAVGGIGALGDLAESLIKRDCRRKDASQVVPGFGGILDVIDSIVFAAPVAYCWLRW